MAKANPRPTLKAALTCDQAIKEEGTGKWTLVGTFNSIMVPMSEAQEAQADAQLGALKRQLAAQSPDGVVDPKLALPMTHPQIGVYFSIANAEGDYAFEIQLVKLADAEEVVLAKVPGRLHAGNRLMTSDLAINLRGIQLPGFGRYAFKLIMDGQFIGEKQIDVLKVRPVPRPPQQPWDQPHRPEDPSV
jgi:hypothetical protein